MTITESSAPVRALHRWVYAEMLIFAIISLFASFVLAIDAIELAADPNAQFTCDISATISCSKVGLSWQANLLGFPNAYLGLMAEPVVITIAVAGLSGVRFPRWIMIGAPDRLRHRVHLRLLAVLPILFRHRRTVPVVPDRHGGDDVRDVLHHPHQSAR